MAHNGPVRLILKGDRAAAARYVRLGRVLLWKLANSALVAGVKSARRAYPLPDGGQIEVEFAGSIASITIDVGAGRRFIHWLNGFVVWPAGPDDAIILSPGEDPARWRSYFYEPESTGYNEVSGTVRGTYKSLFPKNLRHPAGAAYVTCWQNDRGETLSIANNGSRYWPSRYTHPYLLYGTRVLHYGHVTLDLQTYTTASGGSLMSVSPQILGAAFKDGWLYVMCAGLGPLTFPAPPAAPSAQLDIYSSAQFDTSPRNYYLRRFKLVAKGGVSSGTVWYEVVDGSDELLRSFANSSGTGLYAPWVFNHDVTEVVTYSLPANSTLHNKREFDGVTLVSETNEKFQADNTLRVSITIDTTPPEPATSLATEASGTRIAESNGRVMHLLHQGAGRYVYSFEGVTYPAYSYVGTDTVAGAVATSAMLVDADLDNNTFLFAEFTHTVTTDTSFYGYPAFGTGPVSTDLVVHQAGVEVSRQHTTPGDMNVVIDHTGNSAASAYCASVGASALSRLYVVCVLNRVKRISGEITAQSGGITPVSLRRYAYYSELNSRYSTTGGSAHAFKGATTLEWSEQYMGYDGNIDQWDGQQPSELLAYNAFAASEDRCVYSFRDRFPEEWYVYAGHAEFATGIGESLAPLIGTTLSAARISTLGAPTIEQETFRDPQWP